jgi:hypothetical protein
LYEYQNFAKVVCLAVGETRQTLFSFFFCGRCFILLALEAALTTHTRTQMGENSCRLLKREEGENKTELLL